MAKFVLSCASGRGEMALFSADALAGRSPDHLAIAELEAQGLLLRLPTCKDRADLLHVFVDEPVGQDLLRYCDVAGVVRGRLQLTGGGLAFGALASLSAGRVPNDAPGSAAVSPDRYEVLAYRTTFSHALVQGAVQAKLGKQGQKHVAALLQIVLSAVVFTGLAILFRAWFLAALIALAAGLGVGLFLRHPRTKALRAMTREVERDYPGIVVELRSTGSA